MDSSPCPPQTFFDFCLAMNPRFWIYLALVLVGLVVLCWPEKDNLMLVQFSETHGPSRLDSIGLLFIMIGYTPMVVTVIRRFQFIQSRLGKARTIYLIATSFLFSGMIGLALNLGSDALLWVSVAISSLSQAVVVYYGFRMDDPAVVRKTVS